MISPRKGVNREELNTFSPMQVGSLSKYGLTARKAVIRW